MKHKRTKGPWDVRSKKCPCGCWGKDQHRWFEILDHFGNEKDAVKYIASRLREAADHIETGRYPRVFGVECSSPDEKMIPGLLGSVSVTLSHPWPG